MIQQQVGGAADEWWTLEDVELLCQRARDLGLDNDSQLFVSDSSKLPDDGLTIVRLLTNFLVFQEVI